MSLPAGSASAASSGAGAVLVVAVLVSVYGLNARAINSVDTNTIQHTALALAATGRADLSAYDSVVASGLDMGYIAVVDGEARSSYPLLPALIAAPAYRLALMVGALDAQNPDAGRVEAIGSIVATILVALACAVLFLTIVGSCPFPVAFVIAVVCGLATPLWSSASQALWSHAPAALLLALGLRAVVASGQPDNRRLWLGGLALALAVSCRALLVVFPVGMTVALLGGTRRSAAAFVAGLATGAGLIMLANLIWLGSPLGGLVHLYTTGISIETHGVATAWTGNWLEGLAGIFVSPSRGLLIYMPVVLLAFAGVRRAWHTRRLRYGVLLPVVAFLAIWAKYAVWWGGHSFGPRFASDIAIPLAILGSLAVDASLRLPALARGIQATFAAVVVAWSVGVQFVGALCYPAGDWNARPLDVDRAHERLWDWRDSQLTRTLAGGTYRQYRASQSLAPLIEGAADGEHVADADDAP